MTFICSQYHIDGRDPNGYVGCMWSICGVHDQVCIVYFTSFCLNIYLFIQFSFSIHWFISFCLQGWKERPVFGKIRYMNYAGCKRKFDVDGYIAYVKKLVGGIKKRKGETLLDSKTKQGINIQNLHK